MMNYCKILMFSSAIFMLWSPDGALAVDAKEEKEKPAAREVAEKKEKKSDETLEQTKEKVTKTAPPPLSEIGLLELETRSRQLEARAKELEERERAIKIQEKILSNKMKRIEEISEKMAERLDVFKKASQGKITKLVTVIEAMKPDAAAKYFESVDPYLAVEVLTRIDIKRAAKILNKVDKDKSARLTELYTGYRSKIQNEAKSKDNSAG